MCRVLASGIARLVSFQQVIGFTNKNPEAFLKDTPCQSSLERRMVIDCIPKLTRASRDV